MSDHLGERLTLLVDGRLDHAERERVLAHLAHCGSCRHEVDAHRRLKATLTALRAAPPQPGPDLTARLLAVASQERVALPLSPAVPPSTPRRSRRPRGAVRPLGRAGALRPRRAATAGVLLAVGLAGALALGAPGSSGPAAPFDPASPALVADHVSTSSGVPLSEPVSATVIPAGAAGPGR